MERRYLLLIEKGYYKQEIIENHSGREEATTTVFTHKICRKDVSFSSEVTLQLFSEFFFSITLLKNLLCFILVATHIDAFRGH